MIAKRSKSQCKTCCLEGTCGKLMGNHPATATIMVLGNRPAPVDIEDKKARSSGYGKMLLAMLAEGGANPRSVWFSHLMNCTSTDPQAIIEGEHKCRPGLEEELAAASKAGVKVILAVGDEVTKALGIAGDILKIRGSVFDLQIAGTQFYVIPTYDPLYIVRGNQHQIPVWVADIEKAALIGSKGWEPPKEDFEIYPTIGGLRKLVESLPADSTLAFDLETTSLNPAKARIIVAGFAIDGERAFSIPFMKQGGANYWKTLGEQQEATDLLRKLCTDFTLVMHNAAYDTAVLRWHDIELGKLPHDTMLMHHAFHPELPHGLGFVGSIYATTPYWKDAVLGSAHKMIDLPDEELRTYNLRDCVVLHQIMPSLLKDLDESGTRRIYETISRELVGVVVDLQFNGMRLLDSRLPKWKEEVLAEKEDALNGLLNVEGVSAAFKPSSPHHLRYLLFGTLPASFDNAKADLESYDQPGCRKKKNTAVYADLVSRVGGITGTAPLVRIPNFTYLTTKKGARAVGKQALTKMKMGAMAEIEKINSYRRKPADIQQRYEAMHRILFVVNGLLKYQAWAKLASTYLVFPAGDDGRIHPSYKIHGTTTGRLASEGPKHQLGSQLVMAA